MLVPSKWLRELVDYDITDEELAKRLTMAGTQLEAFQRSDDGELVFDFDIMPNRPDCLSIVGIAREASAVTGKPLVLPEVTVREGERTAGDMTSVAVEDAGLCPRYIARIIYDVKVGPSPLWMQRRLQACGVRPINNVVDITNYVMLELNQPLHAFDYDLLSENRIIVRRARPGERIVTLDGEERPLDHDVLVIADATRPVAIAGVMGGLESEVRDDSRTILLESANFDRVSIWRTSRRLKLRTEASTRFEKGLDPNNARLGADRACQLMEELGVGKVARGAVDIYPSPEEPKVFTLRSGRIGRLLGIDISADEIAEILGRLSMSVERLGDHEGLGEHDLRVTVPTFRRDISGEADFVEEVARIHGYERINASMLTGAVPEREPGRARRLMGLVRDIVRGCGFSEAITFSFTSPKMFDVLRLPQDSPCRDAIAIMNPLTEEQSIMRTTLLGSMLEVLELNISRGNRDVAVFELGRRFLKDSREPSGCKERETLAGAAMGSLSIPSWGVARREVDFYDIKGVIEELLSRMGVRGFAFERCDHPSFHPGRCARVVLGGTGSGGTELGVFGELHPEVRAGMGFPGRPYLFELDLDELVRVADPAGHVRPLPRHPSVVRDIAVIAVKDLPCEAIEEAIRSVGGDLVEDVRLFDVYEGSQIPEGHRSLAFSVTYRAQDRTLTDEEVNAIWSQVRDKLVAGLGVSVRQ
ncbi:MAG: phenylalanine--tRNA ligase subunit beta [Firmicutes bacterium]|nr:phenylalanine--tRNA ligase subunit beta [Bacillota bacterium]